MEIIDFHAHIYPDKIAEKASRSVGEFYSIPMEKVGSVEALFQSGDPVGVGRYVVQSVATTPHQVASINNFISQVCREHPDRLIGFGTLHPQMEGLEEEMERILSRGYRGIKLHPDFQEFNIDEDRAMEIYRLAEGKLAILFHTGDARYDYSAPSRLEKVAERFPKLTCIAAHFGGYSRWDEAMDAYEAPNIYMDTSSALFALPKEKAWEFFRKFGEDRFFFGTDFPMWTHEDEMVRFNALELPPDMREKILWKNFAKAILKE